MTKYNYNNPIMGKYLQNKTSGKHINVSGGSSGHSIKPSGVGSGVTKTVYIINNGGYTQTTAQSTTTNTGMTAAEKFALGASILTGGLQGTAEIIKAINEAKAAKGGQAGGSAPQSTETDDTKYSTGNKPSGSNGGVMSMEELSSLDNANVNPSSSGSSSTIGSSKPDSTVATSAAAEATPTASKKASNATAGIDKAIEEYEKEGTNNKDRRKLESEVRNAVNTYNSYKEKINKAQTKYDEAVKAREEFEKTIAETDTKYDDAVASLEKELSTGKFTSVDDAKRTLSDKETVQQQKQEAYDNGVKDADAKVALVTEKQTAFDEADKAVKEAESMSDEEVKAKFGKTKDELKEDLKTAKKELEDAIKDRDEAKKLIEGPNGELFKALKAAIQETETARGDFNVSNRIATTLREKQETHDKNLDTLDKKYKKAETSAKQDVDKTEQLKTDNEALKASIKKGNEALKNCAVPFTE